MSGATSLVAASVVRAQWSPPKVVVTKPATRGVVTAIQGDALADQVVSALRELFPCAKVLTYEEAALFVKYDRERKSLGVGEEDAMANLGEQLDADLVISLSFFTTGTTHASPQRHASMSMLDPRQARTVDRSQASGDGWNWASKDVIPELIAELRQLDLCPWLGTVEYQRSSTRDTSWTAGPTPES